MLKVVFSNKVVTSLSNALIKVTLPVVTIMISGNVVSALQVLCDVKVAGSAMAMIAEGAMVTMAAAREGGMVMLMVKIGDGAAMERAGEAVYGMKASQALLLLLLLLQVDEVGARASTHLNEEKWMQWRRSWWHRAVLQRERDRRSNMRRKTRDNNTKNSSMRNSSRSSRSMAITMMIMKMSSSTSNTILVTMMTTPSTIPKSFDCSPCLDDFSHAQSDFDEGCHE